jgi:hypothetical protein
MAFSEDLAEYSLPKIEHIWAFVSFDERDQSEGVIGAMMNGTMMPLIAADENRLKSLRPYALKVAVMHGITIKLIKFSSREEMETIAP